MNSRGRRVLVALASVAGLLFLGRWSVDFLAMRWWAGVVSPAGDLFSVRWSLLKVGLEIATIGTGTAWFWLTLWQAARHGARVAGGVGAVAEAPGVLPPAALRHWALGIALLLGILSGTGSGAWAPAVALARQAPRFGLFDPHLGWDAGFYLAMLPVLQLIHQFVLALVLLGFVATAMLYAVAGALRVTARQFSLDPAIRLHLGALGTLLALLLGAGYLLEPLELIAGMRPSMGPAHAVLLMSLARLMAGFSLAVALLTIFWAVRGRVMLPVGGWASYALFAIAVRLLAPTAGTMGAGTSPEATLRELEQEAFAIPTVIESEAAELVPAPLSELVPSVWSAQLVATGQGPWLGADQVASGRVGEGESLVLVAARPGEAGGADIYRVPVGQATAAGGPLSVRPGGSDPLPGLAPALSLATARILPGQHEVQVEADGPGVRPGGFLRRLALTWALQRNLLTTAPDASVNWMRDPGVRLGAVAPFAAWGTPRPRLVEGGLVWVSVGYLHGSSFPGVAPVVWRGRPVSYLRAAFLGVVDAADGLVEIYERGPADPMTRAWTAIARGMVRPVAELPAVLSEELHYPDELLGVQGRILQRAHWGIGALDPVRGDTLTSPVERLFFVERERDRIVAVVEASHQRGHDELRLVRFDSLASLDGPALLAQRWERLPYVTQMSDSIRAAGARLSLGPVHLVPGPEGLIGYQAGHAVDSSGRATLAVVNLALGGRLGTGPRLESAWRNLRGEVAALPVSIGAAGQLREARTWLLRADSAFRRGDLPAFGRAFEALRAILDYPPGPPK